MELKEWAVTSRGHAVHLDSVRGAGWFGRDNKGSYTEREMVIKYLKLPRTPEVKFDLTLKHKKDEMKTAGGHIDHLYKWIMSHSKDQKGNPKRPEEKFISYLRFFNQLLLTPYEDKEGWDVYAAQVHGVIYLHMEEQQLKSSGRLISILKKDSENSELGTGLKLTPEDVKSLKDGVDQALVLKIKQLRLESEEKQQDDEDEDIESNVYSRFGHKFEHYLLSDTPDGEPNPKQPISRFGDMNVVFRANLGRHRLMYAGEMDGLPNADALKNLAKAPFVELKTVGENLNPRTYKRYKLLKFWSQCVLANCKSVLLGHRDDGRGEVRKLELFDVAKIPTLAEDLWSPEKCYEFLYGFLNFVDEQVSAAPEDTMFQFQWRPDDPDVVRSIRLPQDGKAWILPKFYREWLDAIPATEVSDVPVVTPPQTTSIKTNHAANIFMPAWMKS